jgi:hypothetical protein
MTSPDEDPEIARRRAHADELAAECDRLRATRDLLTVHLRRLSPPSDAMTSFTTVADDDATTFVDEEAETLSLVSHATHTTTATTTTGVSRGAKSRGGKSSGCASRRSRRKKRNGKSSSSGGGGVIQLSSRDKRVLANTELEILEGEFEKQCAEAESRLEGLRAELEEMSARRSATEKEFAEFERDVASSKPEIARSKPRGTALPLPSPSAAEVTSAEKWIKHVEALTRQKKAEADQLYLKTFSKKTKIKHLEAASRQKERAGKGLTAIDHETLRIERDRRLKRLESRNQELRRLAAVASRASDRLQKCKLELETRSEEGRFLKADAAAKRVMLVSFDVLMIQVKADHSKVAKINKDLHVAGSSGDTPAVGEYVRVKDASRVLEQKVKDAERKLELAEAKRGLAESPASEKRALRTSTTSKVSSILGSISHRKGEGAGLGMVSSRRAR